MVGASGRRPANVSVIGEVLGSNRISGVIPCMGSVEIWESRITSSRRSRLEAHSILMSSAAVGSNRESGEISGSLCKPLKRLGGTRDNQVDTFSRVRSDETRGFVGGGRREKGESRRRTRSYGVCEPNDFMCKRSRT